MDRDTTDEIIRLYQAGVKVADIAAEAGVSRGTVYELLRSRGYAPNRQARPQGEVTVAAVLEQWAEAQRRIGRLESQIDDLNKIIADLRFENERLRELHP